MQEIYKFDSTMRPNTNNSNLNRGLKWLQGVLGRRKGDFVPLSDSSYSIEKLDENGLTLIEVMIALTVFTIGILAVAGMQGISMKTVGNAHRQSRQSICASNLIEDILTKPYDHQLLKDQNNGYTPGSPDHGPYAMEGCPATIEWEVQDDFPVQGTKRITVTVRSVSRGGRQTPSPSIFKYVKASEK